MKRIVGWFVAAGLCLGFAGISQAAPVTAGSAAMTREAVDGSRTLVTDVGYYRRNHRRGYNRHVYYARPVYRHRQVYNRPVFYRPAYQRPVQFAPLYASPVYYGGYGYGPRCYIKVRKVYTLQGLRRKHVRVCNY